MFTENEKLVLKKLVKEELKKFENEEKSIIEVSPEFLKGETKYEEFLKKLISKLN